jgi:RNA polymerase sigma-70 factor (ECF subfamily)
MNRRQQESYWVLQAQSGDLKSLDALLRSVHEDVYRYLVTFLGDATIAEDVLQESLIRAYRKLKWLRDPAAFRPWLFRIATRQAYRSFGRRSRQLDLPREIDVDELYQDRSPDPGESLERDEVAAIMSRSLDQLSPASRSVLSLHYLQQLSLQETADVLDLSLGTVKSRLAYGLKQLRKQLPPSATHEIAGRSSISDLSQVICARDGRASDNQSSVPARQSGHTSNEHTSE